MHPFTDQPASRPFSNSPLLSIVSVPTANIGFLVPLYHQTCRTRFFRRFLNQTEITRAKLSPDTRIHEFEKKFKSECAKSNHVHPPALRRLGNKVPTSHRDGEVTERGSKKGRSLLKRGINYARIPIGIKAFS